MLATWSIYDYHYQQLPITPLILLSILRYLNIGTHPDDSHMLGMQQ
jgi:hypothetical protein